MRIIPPRSKRPAGSSPVAVRDRVQHDVFDVKQFADTLQQFAADAERCSFVISTGGAMRLRREPSRSRRRALAT